MKADTTREHRLSKIKELIDLYFEPWGAAKAAQWEDLANDAPFTEADLLAQIRKALHD